MAKMTWLVLAITHGPEVKEPTTAYGFFRGLPSDLTRLTAKLERKSTDFRSVLVEAIEALPPPGRTPEDEQELVDTIVGALGLDDSDNNDEDDDADDEC